MGVQIEIAASQKGRIRWYSVGKNYGFLLAEDGREIFVHHASIVYSGLGRCEHNRGICARAMSLLSDEKQQVAMTRQANHEFNARKFETLLEGEPVLFRLFESPRGLEARSVKRASV